MATAGVYQNSDGGWVWRCECGAEPGKYWTSRELARDSYKDHRLRHCERNNPTKTVGVTEEDQWAEREAGSELPKDKPPARERKGKMAKKKTTKKAAKGKAGIKVDLGAMGVDKLLGTGNVNTKIEVVVPQASQRAVEKVEKAGGSVKLTAGSQ